MTQIRIKVEVPEMVFNSSAVHQAIKEKMRSKTGPDIKKEFEKTVDGWETAPDFRVTVYESVNSIITHVFPSGIGTAQYVRVNEGVGPHLITPRRRGGRLRFQTGYRAATRPRVIGSRSKGRFGNEITALAVRHPGFEARKFDEVIADEYTPTFEQDMQDAIAQATGRR